LKPEILSVNSSLAVNIKMGKVSFPVERR
jgi:hypothetical protein